MPVGNPVLGKMPGLPIGLEVPLGTVGLIPDEGEVTAGDVVPPSTSPGGDPMTGCVGIGAGTLGVAAGNVANDFEDVVAETLLFATTGVIGGIGGAV